MRPKCTVRVKIAGRVQGVGYRLWTRREARALDVAGWVRNRRDGSVEAVFEGSPEAVRAMVARCAVGPSGAVVAGVTETVEDAGDFSGFEIRATA